MRKFIFLSGRSFWLMIISFIVLVIFSSIFNFSWSKTFYKNRIQKEIIQTEKGFNDFFSNSKIIHDDIDYVKFSNDSLIKWTTHHYPAFDFASIDSSGVDFIFADNGIFLTQTTHQNHFKYILFRKFYHIYPYENEFLKNGFTWNEHLYNGIKLTDKTTNYPLKNENGDTIAFLSFDKNITLSSGQSIILLILYLVLFISFLSVCHQIINHFFTKQWQIRLTFYTLIFLAWFSFLYFPGFPLLEETNIFQPVSFAYSGLFSSIIHLFFTLIAIFVFLLAEYNLCNKTFKISVAYRLLQWISLGGVYILFVKLIPLLIKNTASVIEFNELSQVNLTSILVLLSLVVSIFISITLINIIIKDNEGVKLYEIALVLILSVLIGFILSWFYAALHALLMLIVLIWHYGKLTNRLTLNLVLTLFFSLQFAIGMNISNEEKEIERRKIFIQTLALNQDPEVEYLFGVMEKEAYADTSFNRWITSNWYQGDLVTQHIKHRFFKGNKHWERYDFQITSCDNSTSLLLKPSNIEISCDDYFFNNLISKGYITSNNNLYRMEYGSGQINYLGILRFSDPAVEGKIVTIYLEINSKIKRKGFTKLLSSKGMDPFENIRDYSLSRYKKGYLSETYGEFSYSSYLKDTLQIGQMIEEVWDGYSHLIYKPSHNSTFILSKVQPSFLQQIAPFANIFVLMILLSAIFFILLGKSIQIWSPPQTFSFRLQFYIIALLAISLIITSIISGYFISRTNTEKDLKNQNRTAISLQKEFEQKLSKTVKEGQTMNDFLYDLSLKFSNVFNTDINLYDLNGQLLSATMPQLFNNSLLQPSMNPDAFYMLREKKYTYINLTEKIGSLVYYSAYLPFHDNNGDVVAYLNLPRIALQDELSKEVSSFIMTLLNVYMLIMVIAVILVLLLSNYILRPLRIIRERMQQIKINEKNAHIEWSQKDELGELVKEYNLMVDQIAESAQLLARAERESAWQQMAQQVAHEIKNPLTPMKLSLQYLMKSIDENKPNVEQQIKNLSQTLIDQIDTLAAIATAFSDFAKMPSGKMEEVDLIQIIESSIYLFKDKDKVQFKTIFDTKTAPAYGDRKNLLRVLNNIITNALQSFDNNKKGEIKIYLTAENDFWKLSVEDNGSGIKESEKSKIFQPNFTTKSSGMGLGLAMVRNIILQHGGRIDFESTEGKGSTFMFWIKKYE